MIIIIIIILIIIILHVKMGKVHMMLRGTIAHYIAVFIVL